LFLEVDTNIKLQEIMVVKWGGSSMFTFNLLEGGQMTKAELIEKIDDLYLDL